MKHPVHNFAHDGVITVSRVVPKPAFGIEDLQGPGAKRAAPLSWAKPWPVTPFRACRSAGKPAELKYPGEAY